MRIYMTTLVSLVLYVIATVTTSNALPNDSSIVLLPNTNGYSVSIPRELISNTFAKICLYLRTVSDFDGELTISLSSNSSNIFVTTINISQFEGTHKCVHLFVPQTDQKTATLQLKGYFDNGNYLIADTAKIPIMKESPISLISSTDDQPDTNFTVDITVNPQVILKDFQQLNLTICAKFNDGNSVNGLIKATIWRFSSAAINNNQTLVHTIVKFMHEKCHLENTSRAILGLDDERWHHLDMLNITAQVTDTKTKAKVSASHLVQIKNQDKYTCKIIDNKSNQSKNLMVEIQTLDVNDDDNNTMKKVDNGSSNGRDFNLVFCPDETISSLKAQIASLERSHAEMLAKINSMNISTEFNMTGEHSQNQSGITLNEHKNELNDSATKMDSMKKSPTTCSEEENFFPFGLKQFRAFVYSWEITGINRKMEHTTFEQESPVFPLNGYPFSGKAKVQLKEDFVHMCLKFVYTKSYKKPIEIAVKPEISYILKDRIGTDKDMIRKRNYLHHTVLIYNKYYCEIPLIEKAKITDSPYAINDSVVVDIYVESPSMTQLTQSNDGVMTWKICDLEKKISKSNDQQIYSLHSPYFYTSPNGYRVQARMWLNGYEQFKGQGWTVEIDFLSGEFDSSLPMSFYHKTTVTIFNQRDSTKHLVKSINANAQPQNYYFINFTQSEIHDSGLPIDDTLIYRVVIETL